VKYSGQMPRSTRQQKEAGIMPHLAYLLDPV